MDAVQPWRPTWVRTLDATQGSATPIPYVVLLKSRGRYVRDYLTQLKVDLRDWGLNIHTMADVKYFSLFSRGRSPREAVEAAVRDIQQVFPLRWSHLTGAEVTRWRSTVDPIAFLQETGEDETDK